MWTFKTSESNKFPQRRSLSQSWTGRGMRASRSSARRTQTCVWWPNMLATILQRLSHSSGSTCNRCNRKNSNNRWALSSSHGLVAAKTGARASTSSCPRCRIWSMTKLVTSICNTQVVTWDRWPTRRHRKAIISTVAPSSAKAGWSSTGLTLGSITRGPSSTATYNHLTNATDGTNKTSDSKYSTLKHLIN